jgi:hypothetical protein
MFFIPNCLPAAIITSSALSVSIAVFAVCHAVNAKKYKKTQAQLNIIEQSLETKNGQSKLLHKAITERTNDISEVIENDAMSELMQSIKLEEILGKNEILFNNDEGYKKAGEIEMRILEYQQERRERNAQNKKSLNIPNKTTKKLDVPEDLA